MGESKQVSASRVIPAPADKIFAVLADPRQHCEIDGSGTVQSSKETEPDRLELGSKFGMSMHAGMRYSISNEVVEFEEGRLIGWRHMGHHVWRYELEAVEGGTSVTETFDWRKARAGFAYPWFSVPKKNLASIEKTLEPLDAHVTGSDSDAS